MEPLAEVGDLPRLEGVRGKRVSSCAESRAPVLSL